MPLNPHPAKQLTLAEVHDVIRDVQRMLEQYQLQAGLRFDTCVMIINGPLSSFAATLQPERLVTLLRALADRVEREELDGHEAPAQPTAH
jgi:hypothetical protein